jgi:hypothetical protein
MAPFFQIYKINDFIKATESGIIDLERSVGIVTKLVIATNFHKDVNILIDLRETNMKLNFTELLNVALEFALYKNYFKNKIAILIPDNPDRIKRAEFLKTQMKTEGFKYNYFTDYEKAIDWLSDITPKWDV